MLRAATVGPRVAAATTLSNSPRAACLFTFGIELILPIRDTGIAYFSDIDLALFDNG